MKIKQILSWAVVAFIAAQLIINPGGVGHFIHNDILGGLRSAGNSLAGFFNSI